VCFFHVCGRHKINIDYLHIYYQHIIIGRLWHHPYYLRFRMSSKPSLLEQSCVIKGGLLCVTGCTYNGSQYDIEAADFIVRKVSIS
jgi:hypothetical protein